MKGHFQSISRLAGHGVKRVVTGNAHHPHGIDGFDQYLVTILANDHIARQQDANGCLSTDRPVGEGRVTCAEDEERADVGVEFGLHGGLHVYLGEDAEALFCERAACPSDDFVEWGGYVGFK